MNAVCTFLRFYVIFLEKHLVNKSILFTFVSQMKEMSPYRVKPGRVKKRVRLIAVTKDAMEVVNKTTGEVKAATPYVGNRAWRDVSDFVKVYDLAKVASLGIREVKVFCYIMDAMDFNGRVVFDCDACYELTGLGSRSAYYGLKGLVEKDFIRRDGGGAYWVNPNIAFRGNRDELMQIV